MAFLARLKTRAHCLKTETLALYFAARHPATPWYARAVVAGVVAYALSPIDLIPDFIPVLGYVDDLILLPLGILLCIKMIPPEVMAECRARARHAPQRPVSRATAAVIVSLWIALALLCVAWFYRAFS